MYTDNFIHSSFFLPRLVLPQETWELHIFILGNDQISMLFRGSEAHDTTYSDSQNQAQNLSSSNFEFQFRLN